MTFTVRRAKTSDIDAIIRLRIAFLSGERVVRDPDALRAAVRPYLERAIPSGDFAGWVAEADGEIVATGGMTIYERMSWDGISREGYVLNMYTLPEWRRRGISTAIVDAMLSFARSNELRLCLIALDEARRLYERLGFEADPRYLRWR